jgi:hypothetical protein
VQREGFLAAQPGCQHEPEQRFEPVAPNGIQEPVRGEEPVAYGHVQRSP